MKGSKFISMEYISDGYVSSSSKERQLRSVLTLRNVTPADATDYKCIAINPAGRSEVGNIGLQSQLVCGNLPTERH